MQVFESAEEFRKSHAGAVVTVGKYDGMHLGHQRILANLLEQACELDLPALVILSEPHPEEYFRGDDAPPRLSRFADKVAFLERLGVDAVFRLSFDAATSALSASEFMQDLLLGGLGSRSIVVGHDFCFGRNRSGNVETLRRFGAEHGISVTEVAPVSVENMRVSSTLVRSLLEAGDCDGVSRLLGRPYNISGTVRPGRRLGRELGFPTANVALEFPRLPLSGVYAVRVKHARGITRGVANVGVRPTVDTSPTAHLEVHLFAFGGDLYDEEIDVSFLHKIRDEQRFPSLDALRERIASDAAQARAYFWKGEAYVV